MLFMKYDIGIFKIEIYDYLLVMLFLILEKG